MRRAIVLLCLGLLASCGRDGSTRADMTQVSLGLTGQAGQVLSAQLVTHSLEVLDFSLTAWSGEQVCQAGSCVWRAEGRLPYYHLELLQGFQDQVLKVVFARVQQPAPGAGGLPRR
jgi:hypothetical protein